MRSTRSVPLISVRHTIRFKVVLGTVSLSAIAVLGSLPGWAGPAEFNQQSPSSSYPVETTEQSLYIQISLSHRQLTLYRGQSQLKTYPVAVGRDGWQTPVGSFSVQQMVPDPAWRNPFTGEVIGGGDPDNPLGRYWIGFWTDGTNWVGMHGTPNPDSVGRAASHGCIRLYNSDIQELFALVDVGTPVVVVP